MNKGIYLMSCIALVACSGIAVGNQPFKDVKSNSWAYGALNQLQEEGIVTGYPDGTFKGDNTLTRFEMAQIVAKAMAHADKAPAQEQALINKLATTYSQELQNLGVKVDSLEDRMGSIKMTGDLRLRYMGSDDFKSGQPGRAYALAKGSYFDWRTRLGLQGQVNDATKVGLRLNVGSEFGNATGNSLWFDRIYITHAFNPNLSLTAGRYEQMVGNGLSYFDSFDGVQVQAKPGPWTLEAAYGHMVTDGFKNLATKENPTVTVLNVKRKLGRQWTLGTFGAHSTNGQIRRYNDTPAHPNRMGIPNDSFYGLSVDYNQGAWWAGGEWLQAKETDKTRTWTAGLSYGTFSFAKQKAGTWLGKVQYVSEEAYSPVITSAFAFGYDLSTPRMSQYDGYKGWMATGRYALWDNAVISAFYGFNSKDQAGRPLPNYYRAEINLRF